MGAYDKVTAAVHAKGSYIFLQIWALGRGADPASLEKDGISSFVAPSPIPLKQPFYPGGAPRELTIDEIQQYISWYAEAASISVHQAGFDGVEIHVSKE
jgi:NADPH2 dehydrogenase